jgi:hypothetical protein
MVKGTPLIERFRNNRCIHGITRTVRRFKRRLPRWLWRSIAGRIWIGQRLIFISIVVVLVPVLFVCLMRLLFGGVRVELGRRVAILWLVLITARAILLSVRVSVGHV